MPHSRPLYVVWLLCFALCGCAQTATVHYWSPAELNAPHVSRIAIDEIESEHAAEIAVALRERLDADEPAESAGQVSAVRTTGGEQKDEGSPRYVLCRPEEADAIITCQVLEYGCADKLPNRSLLTALDEDRDAAAQDAIPPATPGELRVREAGVRLQLELVDVCSGDVLAERTVTRNREWGVTPKCRTPEDDEVLRSLTAECLDEFVAVMQPKRMQEQVELAEGEWYDPAALRIRRGVSLARRGRWSEAERAWQAVLESSPENDAALFNLAIAAAQREAYDEAEEYAMQALRLRHTACYAAGLDQLRRFRADAERIERQLPPPIVAASHRAWDDRR